MNAKKIIAGQWYETKQGTGKCLYPHGRSFVFEIGDKVKYLASNEVQHEIAKGQEPQVDPQAPNEAEPWKDTWRHCQHCQKRTKHMENEPPPTVCWHCGKDLIIKKPAENLVYESRKISDWSAELDRLREINTALLAACQQASDLSQHADGCRWWNIPVTSMNDSERSQAEQREACNCHLKACREAIAKAKAATS